MQLFHASCRLYAAGNLLQAHERKMPLRAAETERRLSSYAPLGLPSRLAAVFASDNPAFAAYYLSRENNGSTGSHLYRVEAQSWSRHPMALVDVAGQVEDERACAVVAKEYWTPTRNWRCWEFLCIELRIVEEDSWPDPMELVGASYAYGLDRDEAKRLQA